MPPTSLPVPLLLSWGLFELFWAIHHLFIIHEWCSFILVWTFLYIWYLYLFSVVWTCGGPQFFWGLETNSKKKKALRIELFTVVGVLLAMKLLNHYINFKNLPHWLIRKPTCMYENTKTFDPQEFWLVN